MSDNENTFVPFIDLKKAFDFVDNLLMYRLLLANIDGKMYKSIKDLYCETYSCVKVNNLQTDWFQSMTGVRQRDNLSPPLFNIFMNDLIVSIKSTNLGVKVDDKTANIFTYALLAST